MGPWSIIGIMGHFTSIFAPKITFFQFAQSECGLCLQRTVIVPLLSQYLSITSVDAWTDDVKSGTKSMTSQRANMPAGDPKG